MTKQGTVKPRNQKSFLKTITLVSTFGVCFLVVTQE